MKTLTLILFALLCTRCGMGQENWDNPFQKVSPAEVQLNPKPIHDLIADIESGKITNIHGLYIVKETVEKLKGRIKVSSQVMDNTVFTIEIPNLKLFDPSESPAGVSDVSV